MRISAPVIVREWSRISSWLPHRSGCSADWQSIVDITNYVMEEYGQPMHAYDLDTIAGHQILVRRAEEGEKFVTLDGQERTMDENVLMICDGEKAVGIAGIMGGENSMITDHVKTMLFEYPSFRKAYRSSYRCFR